MAGSDSKGKYIYGKHAQTYPCWIYDNYRLCEPSGRKLESAVSMYAFYTMVLQLKKRALKKRNSCFCSLKVGGHF